ncbi:MAG: D-2-hydroxyacid dehydrogenase [Anaerolineales bacterium]
MSKPTSPIDVLITMPFGSSLIKPLQEVSPLLRITVHPAKNVNDVPDDLWARCEVLYTDRLLPDAELAPNLKWIQHHYAGLDPTVGFTPADRPNLVITTLSGAATSQIAEYVLTMLLAFGRQLPALSTQQRKAEWPKDRWERFMPRELRTSTVGIVGYGSIGRQVARLLREFGSTVLATKNDAMQPGDSGYTPEGLGDPEGDLVHRLYPGQAIKSMVKDCDFIVVCVPLTENTRGLIDAEVLAACKPTAYLIDVSRGGILDHPALIKALNDHKLAGAALDVFPEEPLPSKSPLWGMTNVILTPHIAGISGHYDERAMALFAENLARYIADLPLYNIFNPQRGY